MKTKKNKGKTTPAETRKAQHIEKLKLPDTPRQTNKSSFFLSGVLVLAVVLRLVFLGRADLWEDELLLVMMSDIRHSALDIWTSYWQGLTVAYGWLPLPAIVQNAGMSFISKVVPDIMRNPFFARIPCVLLGVTNVWGVYHLTRNRYPIHTHYAAVLIATATFYPVFYSREIHAYPLLLALAPWSIHIYTRCLTEIAPKIRQYMLLFMITTLLAWTHLTAPMLVFAFAVVAGGRWAFLLHKRSEPLKQKQAMFTMLATGLAGATILPVFIKLLTQGNPHLKEPSPLSLLFILNDMVSKMFLGDLLIPSLLAWTIILAGIFSVAHKRKQSLQPLIHLLLMIIATTLILAAAKRTQYTSARYFAVISPLVIGFTAQGFFAFSELLAKLVFRNVQLKHMLGGILISLFLATHILIFLPLMYQLNFKGYDYRSIAEWLNSNLKPGQAYIMESAYQLRYVSNYYPTPNLLAASPYVHGPDPHGVQTLRERQKDFILRFPETVFVESAFHTDHNGNPWTFPNTHFRNTIELKDEAIQTLILTGIYGNFFRKDLTEHSFMTRFHFNKREDILAINTENGKPCSLFYPNWYFTIIQSDPRGMWTEYARFHSGPTAEIEIANNSNENTSITLVLNIAIATRYSGEINLEIKHKTETVYERSTPLQTGKFHTIRSQGITIPAEGTVLELNVKTGLHKKVEGILLYSAGIE